MSLPSFPSFSGSVHRFSDSHFPLALLRNCNNPHTFYVHGGLSLNLSVSQTLPVVSGCRNFTPYSPEQPNPLPDFLRKLAASAIFLGFGVCALSASASTRTPTVVAADCQTAVDEQRKQDFAGDCFVNTDNDLGDSSTVFNFNDDEMKAAFEKWKSKTYALTVPLRVIALRGSVPPLWLKDFMKSQGKRVRLLPAFRGNLEDIFSELSMPFESRRHINPKSALAADIVTIGDSWLNLTIKKTLIEPMQGVDNEDWFKSLSDKWKVYLRRNSEGKIDAEGRIWAVPYRWGSMVIAYKKSKFQKHKLAPIQDWEDLWRPELAGKISMVDSPREVIGAVLKSMGASYNTKHIDTEVTGGRHAVQQKLAQLRKQVRLFDSMHYLKAFGVGDVWVAVGWSSDVIPAAKRLSNVSVVIPKSGASLWADLWAIPASSNLATNRIGGRVRGPSPLVHQWIEFCLQAQRALPFVEAVITGASPSALESSPVKGPEKISKDRPKLETNLITGVPPAEILAKCEFLEPLPNAAVEDYQWLIDSTHKPSHSLLQEVVYHMSSIGQWLKSTGQSWSRR